jgi:uncharacterized membrane protein YozB (DUF420 family)
MDVHQLPAVNATLNACATVLLVTGYVLIRQGKREAHQKVMVTAFATSILFLICYLVYHAQVGSVPFGREGTTLRTIYLTILLTHVILAATVPVLASITLFRAFKKRFPQHRKIARITFPIWLYVSITGVIVYWMLYQL